MTWKMKCREVRENTRNSWHFAKKERQKSNSENRKNSHPCCICIYLPNFWSVTNHQDQFTTNLTIFQIFFSQIVHQIFTLSPRAFILPTTAVVIIVFFFTKISSFKWVLLSDELLLKMGAAKLTCFSLFFRRLRKIGGGGRLSRAC